MDIKKISAVILSLLLLLGIIYLAFNLTQPQNVEYVGLKNDTAATPADTSETIVGADGQQKNIVVANDPAFNPRSFTAGGDGWLLSVTESQPKVFTGKLLANNGVETFDIFLQEADNFYTGDAKSRKDGAKSEFSIQKQDGQCKDKEGTTFEYSVTALFQNQTINGCGGNVVSTTAAQ